ncbi:MAG: hypothetical protein IPK83_00970 [Planctomycetes bacterium]|nr:hypothetical protein [Planctomycetota bacterium]
MTAFAGGYSLYAPAAALGLIPPIDNIDALDIGGELPPPCPHATPSTPGSTYVDFGTGGSNPAIPAGFFGPGSDPFIGRIDLKGDPFDTNAYGNASMLAQRSNEATLADDPIGTTRTVDLEVTQLSLISINPITVTQNGGQNPQDWNVRVGLSPSIVPVGSLTAQKTHENGGTFGSTLPVQPYLIFTRASNPNDLVTLDTGEQGLPPHFFTSQGTPYVHTVEPSLSVVAPSDGTFVPGVLEVVHGVPSSQVTVQWQESDPSLPSTHTVEPPRYVITTCICLGDLNNDNVVSIVDVPIFVNVLLSVGYNECADMNGDGSNNGADIQQFVIAILNQSTCFPPGGACCLPDSSCSDGSAQDCYNAGGQYQGHGTACDTTTCPSYKTIPPGEDCWITECGYSDYSFADNPIPADFFGPGSDPFLGTIQLGGIPTGPFGTDTSVQRLGTLFFPDPLPATDSIPIELTELNLSSCQPIMITSNGGQNPQPWNVVVDLSSVPAPSGTMTVTKNGPTGGTFDTVLCPSSIYF